MAKTSLPPGFRFHPTDVELVCYYLRRKVMGKPIHFDAISEIDLYKFAPWDLPEKSCLQNKDLEWYFFCPRGRKYSNGLRKNRATNIGYWKTTGKDRSISYNCQTVAMKKTLIFYVGRSPKGNRTDWVMHEYILEDKELVNAGFLQDSYALCRIFQKSGLGPKNGEKYGAPFREEDWEDDAVDDLAIVIPPSSSRGPLDDQHNLLEPVLLSGTSGVSNMPPYSPYSPKYLNLDILLQELSENNNNATLGVQENGSSEMPPYSPYSPDYLNLDIMLQELSENVNNGALGVQENGSSEMPDSLTLHGSAAEGSTISDCNEIYNGLEDLSNQVELKPTDDYFSNNKDKECALEYTLLGIGDGSNMELEDFQFPVEEHCYELAAPNNLFGYDSNFEDLNNDDVPIFPTHSTVTTASAMESSGRNTSWKYAADVQGPPGAFQTTEESGNPFSLHASAGGEQHKTSSNSDCLISNEGKSCAKLQYLLGSLPARPAIAAEYPSALKEEKSRGSISYYGGSILVKAEMSFQCVHSKNGSLGETGDPYCTVCHGRTPLRKLARYRRSSGGGFLFVFF